MVLNFCNKFLRKYIVGIRNKYGRIGYMGLKKIYEVKRIMLDCWIFCKIIFFYFFFIVNCVEVLYVVDFFKDKGVCCVCVDCVNCEVLDEFDVKWKSFVFGVLV